MSNLKVTRTKYKIFTLILMIVVTLSLCACQVSRKNKAKVLLIGLDGASWNLMQPLIEAGKLPHIKQLMDKGCYGVMQVSYPLQSEVIWTTIATGKTHQKHGIKNRLVVNPDTKEFVPPSSNLRNVKAIWNILSENKRKVGIVNYLVTWPPEKVNGVMVAGRKVRIQNDMNYSAQLLAWPAVTELCSKEEFESFKDLKVSLFSDFQKEEVNLFCGDIQEIDYFMANFAKHLLKKQDFDFFCLYLYGTDVVSHRYWKYSNPKGFDVPQEEIEKYKDVINNYYIWCDGIIGDVLNAAGDFDLVILCSDHEFQSKPEVLHLFTKVDYLLELCGLNKIRRWGKEIILQNEPPDRISFTKNIKIIGELSPDEFNAVREEAKKVLREIVVKETGKRFFIMFQDTRYGFLMRTRGLYAARPNRGHHLIIKTKEYKITDILSENICSGDHSESAAIVISGRDIYRNREIESATVYDIVPTILYYMGLPVAKDMAGKVLFEAFEEGYLKKHPAQYIDTYETKSKKGKIEKPIRSADEEKIKELMRSLGYIN